MSGAQAFYDLWTFSVVNSLRARSRNTRAETELMQELSLDFRDPSSKPYFLWSEDMTVGDLREILNGTRGRELKIAYMARIMRECRIPEVWHFVTPSQVVVEWQPLQRHLGRSKKLWTYLLEVWERYGLIPARS